VYSGGDSNSPGAFSTPFEICLLTLWCAVDTFGERNSPSPYLGGRTRWRATPRRPHRPSTRLLQVPSAERYLRRGSHLTSGGQESPMIVLSRLNAGSANVPCSGVSWNLTKRCWFHLLSAFPFKPNLIRTWTCWCFWSLEIVHSRGHGNSFALKCATCCSRIKILLFN
jgi:hypothetical protein